MHKTEYKTLQEAVYHQTLDNGLTVYIVHKPDFRQTYASFTTQYGSVDREFVVASRGERVVVPDGIAHFLEHKMFEEEHGDVFQDFARYGAQANAFTTYDTTTYLFSSTANVRENLMTLLDFVQRPYFTDENVEKEKGIIGQEIAMYDEMPNWRCHSNFLRGLYGDHPMGIDIAGTLSSIQKIRKEDLYDCYETFYHPSNMVLFVVGPEIPERVISWVAENQAKKNYTLQKPVQRFLPSVPAQPREQRVESELTMAQPRVLFGFKETWQSPDAKERQLRETAMEVWMESLLGRGSPLYHALMDEGLTDAGFGSDYELTPWYGHSQMGGNSNHPDELVERVLSALNQYGKEGLAQEDFERVRKKAMGRFFSLLDSPQGIAYVYTAQKLRGIDVFTALDVLERMTIDHVMNALRSHVNEEQLTVSLVRPKQPRELVAGKGGTLQ